VRKIWKTRGLKRRAVIKGHWVRERRTEGSMAESGRDGWLVKEY
jgi:hypothetical protein